MRGKLRRGRYRRATATCPSCYGPGGVTSPGRRGTLRPVGPSRLALVLCLALALRLVHLGAPILGIHSWRQADTASMARNFDENGYRFFFGGEPPR